MAKKIYLLLVRGKEKSYGFEVEIDEKHLPEYQEDGLDFFPAGNKVPVWIINLGYVPTMLFIFFQDIFNFRNPFKKQ